MSQTQQIHECYNQCRSTLRVQVSIHTFNVTLSMSQNANYLQSEYQGVYHTHSHMTQAHNYKTRKFIDKLHSIIPTSQQRLVTFIYILYCSPLGVKRSWSSSITALVCKPSYSRVLYETKSGSLAVYQLLLTHRYVCKCFCELLGSNILSACLVWGL